MIIGCPTEQRGKTARPSSSLRSYVLFNLRLNYSINEDELARCVSLNLGNLVRPRCYPLKFPVLSVYYITVDACLKHEMN